MQTFLNQPEATFYHVTTIENWTTIQVNGLNSNSGRIFVSRIGELPVLMAIALEQLPEVYTTEEIVFIKIPQAKNNFSATEIRPDNQAGVEWTQPFQSIILRKHIPAENLELMMRIKLGEEPQKTFLLTYFTEIANSGAVSYPSHYITNRATELIY